MLNKKAIIKILFFSALCITLQLRCSAPDKLIAEGLYHLSFDANEQEAALLDLIANARKTIDVSLYGFENDPIAHALVEAHQRRNIKVRMSTEFDSEYSSSYQEVILAGIPVKLGNGSGGIMHNKYIIVDSKYLVTGSTNLTGGMFDHFNNLVIFNSPELVKDFQRDFDVQYAGYYSGDKDEGYDQVFGGGQDIDWNEKTHQIGNYTVEAFFTPYNDTFATYVSHASINYPYINYDKDPNEILNGTYKNALSHIFPLIQNAKKSITFLVFAFTDRVVMDLLVKAKNRGVDTKVYMDRNQYRSNYSHSGKSFQKFRDLIGYVKICRRMNGGLLHHKVIIVDDDTVVLGSMNFSSNAVGSNDENYVIIRNAPDLVVAFQQEAARIDKESYPMPIVPDTDDYEEDPNEY